jgi:hypothetical protein
LKTPLNLRQGLFAGLPEDGQPPQQSCLRFRWRSLMAMEEHLTTIAAEIARLIQEDS